MQKNKKRKTMNQNKWIKKHCPNMKEKVVVVTGATGGLGKEICHSLIALDATIVLACRNKKLAVKTC